MWLLQFWKYRFRKITVGKTFAHFTLVLIVLISSLLIFFRSLFLNNILYFSIEKNRVICISSETWFFNTKSVAAMDIKLISNNSFCVSSSFTRNYWRNFRSIFRFVVMNKVLLTVLVFVLVAGVFVDQGEALLRAGRDRIEKMQRDESAAMETAQEELRGDAYCYTAGNVTDGEQIFLLALLARKMPVMRMWLEAFDFDN